MGDTPVIALGGALFSPLLIIPGTLCASSFSKIGWPEGVTTLRIISPSMGIYRGLTRCLSNLSSVLSQEERAVCASSPLSTLTGITPGRKKRYTTQGKPPSLSPGPPPLTPGSRSPCSQHARTDGCTPGYTREEGGCNTRVVYRLPYQGWHIYQGVPPSIPTGVLYPPSYPRVYHTPRYTYGCTIPTVIPQGVSLLHRCTSGCVSPALVYLRVSS